MVLSVAKVLNHDMYLIKNGNCGITILEVLLVSTLVSKKELKRRCLEEGVDYSKVIVIGPRWAETAPRKKGVKSALVRPDLIIRSDGSAVALDGAMSRGSMSLIEKHTTGRTNPNGLSWESYVKSITQLRQVNPFEPAR